MQENKTSIIVLCRSPLLLPLQVCVVARFLGQLVPWTAEPAGAKPLPLLQVRVPNRGRMERSRICPSVDVGPSSPHPGVPFFWLMAPAFGFGIGIARVCCLISHAWQPSRVSWLSTPWSSTLLGLLLTQQSLLIEFIFVWIAFVSVAWIFIRFARLLPSSYVIPTVSAPKLEGFFPLKGKGSHFGAWLSFFTGPSSALHRQALVLYWRHQ